jgi:16S rRNA (uracil1498-N3)-methyltransferase
LPRVFVSGADDSGPIELPSEEVDKLRKVLRLSPGAIIAVLPDDGSIIRCEFQNRTAVPIDTHRPNVEAKLELTVATEIGVAQFMLFSSERTVVKWDEKKAADRVRRLQVIAREASELSFRTRVPRVEMVPSLKAVLNANPEAVVLSEVEGLPRPLTPTGSRMTIVVGPEGGWSPKELETIGDRGVTLGPRVLRVDHAAAAAAAILLLNQP